MNSIIEAQVEFSECFGQLSLKHLSSDELIIPKNMTEHYEISKFLDYHKPSASSLVDDASSKRSLPIEITYSAVDHPDCTIYYFN